MNFIPLDEAKSYLRVDSADEDALIGILLDSAFQLCADIARLTDEDRITLETGEDPLHIRSPLRVSVLYALGYLFEHREEADHQELSLTLRSLLFSVRERRCF